MYTVDRHVVLRGVARKLFGKVGNAGVGDTIGHPQRGNDARRHTADVDDPPAALLFHKRQHQPRDTNVGHQLNVNVIAEFIIGQLVEGCAGRRHRIVDQNINAPAGTADVGDKTFDIFHPADVTLKAPGINALGLNVGDRLVEAFLGAATDRHMRAVIGEHQRGGATDAATPAGDHSDFILQLEIHRTLLDATSMMSASAKGANAQCASFPRKPKHYWP